MRTFAAEIVTGLRQRGHTVEECTAPVFLANLATRNHLISKWFGYCDQFLLFPLLLWWRVSRLPPGSLCVVADQALGPWIPWLVHRPHIVHVHDLLALEAAEHRQPFNRLSWSGRLYQIWIRNGFRNANCFCSVSQATRVALSRNLCHQPLLNVVALNPLTTRFCAFSPSDICPSLDFILPRLGGHPFLFHIGRNWYKNRLGVLEIFKRLQVSTPLHLVLVGALDAPMRHWLEQYPTLLTHVHVLDYASDESVFALYSRASALLFPSPAVGFGWPILEALACGCPVITTARAPMSEVGSDFVDYIPPCPIDKNALNQWADRAANLVLAAIQRSSAEKQLIRQQGISWATTYFDRGRWLDELEAHYTLSLALQERTKWES